MLAPLVVPGILDSLAAIGKYVASATLAADLDRLAAYHLRLAVDEIATNAIVHGYQEAGLQGTLTLQAVIDETSLTVTLEDASAAFDPRTIPAPTGLGLPLGERPIGGLGVYLALQGVDGYDYERKGNRNRQVFVMRRTRKLPPETPVDTSELRKVMRVDTAQPGGDNTMDATQSHLLIVESREAAPSGLGRFLGPLGYRLTVAQDGHSAWDLLTREEASAPGFDLVLLGAGMVELLQQIRADARLSRTPVIMFSETDDTPTVDQALALGADDYLSIPPSPALLGARIGAHVARKRLQDQLQSYAMRLGELKDAAKLAHDLMTVILPLGRALSGESNFDRLLERILTEAKNLCNADGGTLYLRTVDEQLKFTIMRTDSLKIAMGGTTGFEIPFPPLALRDEAGQPNTHNVATRVATEGRSVNIADIYAAVDYDFSGTRAFDKRNNYRSISTLTVPLKDHDNQVIGVLQLLNAQDPESGKVIPFDAYVQQVVESLASLAAVVLNNKLLLEREKDLLQYERELQIGRQIQASFLPSELPQPGRWEMAAGFIPAREVAGDFYDAFFLENCSRVVFVIADVVDKGVGAALFMALFRSLIRAFSEQQFSGASAEGEADVPAAGEAKPYPELLAKSYSAALKNTVELTNNYLWRNHSETNMFATLFIGVMDPSSGQVEYVNGGHNPPMVIGPHGVKALLKPSGPAVGIFPDTDFGVRQTQLDPGDILLGYTDGVTEAWDAKHTLFSEKRLLALVAPPVPSAAALLERVKTSVLAHMGATPQHDDITMLAIRRAPTTDL